MSSVGYPVAYYTARLAGKRRGLLLALILAPWWINYITRMLAWVNLLQDDGYVNKAIGIFGVAPVSWLSGNPFTVVIALAYGYLPYFIIPLFASLDRIDQRLLEASRDLGVGSVRTFVHVTLPLSKMGLVTALVITALPMAGDYYTNAIVSGSPSTTMIGNQIELFLLQGPLKNFGAVHGAAALARPAVLHGLLPRPDPAREQGRADDGRRGHSPRRGPSCSSQEMGTSLAQSLAPSLRARIGHLAVHPVVPAPRPDRGAVLLQRRPVAQQLAGFLHAVVLLRRGVGRRGPQPAAGTARTA